MQITVDHLVLSSRKHQIRRHETRPDRQIRLARNAYLKSSAIRPSAEPWVKRVLVAEARIHAVHRAFSAGNGLIFTSESAMIIHGVSTWWNNPDVTFRRCSKSTHRYVFEPVEVGSTKVPAVAAVQLQSSLPDGAPPEIVHGLPTAPLPIAAIDIARTLHSVQAFYDVSMILRHLSQFDRRDLEASRQREEDIRQQLLDQLDSLTKSKGIRQARRIIRQADAGIESPGEAAVLWMLNLILPKKIRPQTQVPISHRDRTYYGDVCLPGHRLDFEANGKGKFGSSDQDKEISIGQFHDRHNALTDAGWRVINISYDDTRRLPQLVQQLRHELDRAGIPSIPVPPWTRLDAPRINHWSRRF